MSNAVIVDWLGRGGIAQATPAWIDALARRGHDVTVVTRADRELTGPSVRSPAEGPHALVTHRRLARLAARTVEELEPDVVVIQNYVVPPLERALDVAVRRTGTDAIVVIHDHRLHTRAAGTHAGLGRRIRDAHRVVAHSRFVADTVTAATGRRDIAVLPLGVPAVGTGGTSVLPETADRTAINFGIMTRRYKGGDVVCDLAARGVPGWRFAITGVGAPIDRPGITGVDHFVAGPDLAATLAASTAAVLPYRTASQSGAIVLAQSLGVVPVASAVGGLREQIADGVDGLLLPPGAPLADWRDALERIGAAQDAFVSAGRARAARADLAFRDGVDALV